MSKAKVFIFFLCMTFFVPHAVAGGNTGGGNGEEGKFAVLATEIFEILNLNPERADGIFGLEGLTEKFGVLVGSLPSSKDKSLTPLPIECANKSLLKRMSEDRENKAAYYVSKKDKKKFKLADQNKGTIYIDCKNADAKIFNRSEEDRYVLVFHEYMRRLGETSVYEYSRKLPKLFSDDNVTDTTVIDEALATAVEANSESPVEDFNNAGKKFCASFYKSKPFGFFASLATNGDEQQRLCYGGIKYAKNAFQALLADDKRKAENPIYYFNKYMGVLCTYYVTQHKLNESCTNLVAVKKKAFDAITGKINTPIIELKKELKERANKYCGLKGNSKSTCLQHEARFSGMISLFND